MQIIIERMAGQVIILAAVLLLTFFLQWILRCSFAAKRKKNQRNAEEEFLASTDTVAALQERFFQNPTEFENYMAMIFEALGYENVEVTKKSNDGGKDIVMYRGDEKCVAEIKLYSPQYKIGREKIQKLHSAMLDSDAIHSIFVTTSDFTDTACAYAGKHEIDLINGFLLNRLIKEVEDGRTKGEADILYLKDFIDQDFELQKKKDVKRAKRWSVIVLFLYLVYAAAYVYATATMQLWFQLGISILCIGAALKTGVEQWFCG